MKEYRITIQLLDRATKLLLSQSTFICAKKRNPDEKIAYLRIDTPCVHDTEHINIAAKYLTYKTLGIPRYDKDLQHIIFNALGVNTPKSYFNLVEQTCKHQIDFYSLIGGEPRNIIIKSNDGARGIGQIFIHSTKFYEMYDKFMQNSSKDNDILLQIISEYGEIGGKIGDNDQYHLIDTLRTGRFILQEVVNPVKEYRVLYFANGKHMVTERKNESSWQKNVSVAGSGNYLEDYTQDADATDAVECCKKFVSDLESAENTTIPFLSTDIYKTSEHCGIFEFQMQFAFSAMDKHLVAKNMAESINISLE